MGLFNRKKVPVLEFEEVKPVHVHTWKDMPWYIRTTFNGEHMTAGYKIIEPYICITCGERKNVVLEEADWSNIDVETRDKWFEEARQKYKDYLKPRAIVEDMINNIILVKDPGALAVMEERYGIPHAGCGTSAKMYRQKEKEQDYPKIIVPKGE